MKKVTLIFILCLLLFMLGACGSKGANALTEASAIELGSAFIGKMYHIDLESVEINLDDVGSLIQYQNGFIDYLTEDEFTELNNRRIFIIPLEAARNQDNSISVKNIEMKLTKEEEHSMAFDHHFTLEFTDGAGEILQEIEISGQMTISKIEDSLKISRYFDHKIPVELIL